MDRDELKEFLEAKVILYNQKKFIDSDPIQIPHLFQKKEDIEIIGFLVATLAWGNRKSIIRSGFRLNDMMGNSPCEFVLNYSDSDRERLSGFVHRTFNENDLDYFIKALKHIYTNHSGLENVFSKYAEDDSLQLSIHHFKKIFFGMPHLGRTEKHISDPLKNSAAKRINMFLRWMVRKDQAGVDFGIWTSLTPSQLSCPLDVHSGNVARKLGLLTRTQNDGKALLELDSNLRDLDPIDPIKYDFALFGLGVNEDF